MNFLRGNFKKISVRGNFWAQTSLREEASLALAGLVMPVLYPGRVGIWCVGFGGGRKIGEPGEKPS